MKEKLKSRGSTDIYKVLDDIVSLNNQKNGIDLLISSKKEQVKTYFSENGIDQIKSPEVTAYVSTRTKVVYYTEKLKSKLDKKLYNKIVEKKYSLDPKKFAKICIAHDIDPKLFKDSVIINESVDEQELNKMYDLGSITLKDLEGCYESNTTKTIAYRFAKQSETIKVTE